MHTIIEVAAVIIYFFLASQGAFYILCFAKALKSLSVQNFAELRKVVDDAIALPLKILYLCAAGIMITWMVLEVRWPLQLPQALVAGAFLLLATDMVLAFKVSVPLNKAIIQSNTIHLQQEWLKFIVIRGCLSVGGFVLLVVRLLL